MAKYNPSAYADSYTILQKILHVEQWLKDNPQLKIGKSQLVDDGEDPVIEIPKNMVVSPNALSFGDIILVDRVNEQGVLEYVELFQIATADATKFYGAIIGTLQRGPQGATGAAGADGAAATVAVGTVTTGAAGTPASVTNVGTPTAAVLNFVIPQGQPGSSSAGVASLGGATGAITLEPPLNVSNNRLNVLLGEGVTANNGLSTVQGSITLTGTSGTITLSDASTYIALTTAFEQKADINIGTLRYRFVGLVDGSYHYIAVAQTTAAASRNQIDGYYFTSSNNEISYQRYITIIPEPTNAQTGKILTASGAGVYALADAPTPSGVSYLTTAPSSANTDGDLKFVVLSSEPATKYSGYLYFITGA